MSKSKKPAHKGMPEVMRGKRQLGAEDSFCFGCHDGLACFTDCCSDVNIMLTPVDVMRLSRRAGLETSEFLDRHTLTPITKALHLPVKLLKMDEERDKKCPFLADEGGGCTVYEDRPWSCRMYPVGMAIPPARAGVEPEPEYFLFEDDFCKGRGESTEWTIAAWQENQGCHKNEELENEFGEVVSHPWFIGGRQLNPKGMELYHMACYDLDTFRRFVFESTFLTRFELDDEYIEKIRNDDDALLSFAFTWLRFALFGEPTVKVLEGAAPRSEP